MNIKQIITVGVAGMAIGAMALDNVEVTEVKARQRYPWNGLVDIDFQLDSTPTAPYQMLVEVYDNVGKTNLPVKSVCTEGVSVEANPCMVRTDTTRIIWDAAKDLPNGFKCTNVLVTCRDARLATSPKRYMIIDLSEGPTASSYPISYTNCPPPGGWTEEYKLSKLVMRRVEPGAFQMGSLLSDVEHGSDETYHKVVIDMPYYIGVYEVTASQYALIMGGSGTDTKPVEKTWREIRGCDVAQTSTYNGTQAPSVSYSGVGLKWTQNEELMSSWPNSDQVDSGSFIGVLRSKVSIKCDLPTEAQWEMACKAGSITPLYIGDTNSAENAALISGEPVLDPSGSRLIYVGNYMPNALGLYDMTGNVSEWCLDVYAADLGSGVAKNPKGPAESFESFKLLNGKFIDMYDLSVKGTIICGGASAKIPGCYYDLTYVAKGIRRVVKGANARTATRNTELNICYDNPKFRMDYTDYYEKSCTRYEAVNDYDNKKHGIRLMVVADE